MDMNKFFSRIKKVNRLRALTWERDSARSLLAEAERLLAEIIRLR